MKKMIGLGIAVLLLSVGTFAFANGGKSDKNKKSKTSRVCTTDKRCEKTCDKSECPPMCPPKGACCKQ